MQNKTGKVKSKSRFISGKDIGAWLLLLPSMLLVAVLVVRPQILGTVWSFFNMTGFNVKDFCGLDNYRRVLTDTAFIKAFFNTWIYVLWSLVVGALIPFILAIVMNELMHFRKIVRSVIYLPGIMPGVAVSLLWYFMYYPDSTGFLNRVLSVFNIAPYTWLQDSRYTILYIIISMTWSGCGATAIYYFAGLQGINRELYEAALLDGAGFFKRIMTVTVPQMSSMLVLFMIRQCIGVFQVVEQPMQMTGGGPNNASLTLGLLNYRYSFVEYKPQFSLALSIVMGAVLLLFTILYFRLNKWAEDRV